MTEKFIPVVLHVARNKQDDTVAVTFSTSTYGQATIVITSAAYENGWHYALMRRMAKDTETIKDALDFGGE